MKITKKTAIYLSLLLVAGFAGLSATSSSAGASSDKPPSEVNDIPVTQQSGAGETAKTGKIQMDLQGYLKKVWEKNEQIAYQNAEWAVSRQAIRGAKSIFEPTMVGAYQLQDDKRKNTAQQMMSTLNQGFVLPEYWEDSYSQQIAIEELLPIGGKVKLAYSYRDFSDSVNEKYGFDKYKQTVIGASITQPLLKDAGVAPTMAAIRIAEADSDIAFQNYRTQTMRVLAESISAYWDLYLAQRKYQLRQSSQRSAEAILKDNLERVRTGNMSETEVLEARAALASRRSLVIEAKQAVIAAMNNLRTFISLSTTETATEIEAADQPQAEELKRNYADILTSAFKLRGEYLSTRRKIEREDIRLAYAENQAWPQIDLKGSYSLNGLTDKYGNPYNDAMERDHPTWSVGLEFRIPLGGNKKAASEIEAARQRKRQVLLEIKAVEVSIANTVDTAFRNLNGALEQLREQADGVEMKRRLLDTEVKRFHAGKSNSRILLEREEALNSVLEGEAESLARYMKSIYQLELAEGSLLIKQGFDAMEAGLK